MKIHNLVIGVDWDEARKTNAFKVAEATGASIWFDDKRQGSRRAWMDKLEDFTRGLPDDDVVCVFPDDCELHPEWKAVQREMAESVAADGGFSDMQCNNATGPDLYRVGWRYYETTDGFTGFGGMATASWWKKLLGVMPRFPGLQFDETVNVFSQMEGKCILKPSMSMVEHILDFDSHDGNDWQNQTENIRRSVHFDPSKEFLSKTDGLVFVGRTYASNHWRFLWGMTVKERKYSGYAGIAYGVHNSYVEKVGLPPKGTELAEPSDGV